MYRNQSIDLHCKFCKSHRKKIVLVMCVCVCVCVCLCICVVFVLSPLLYPKMCALGSECKIYKANFTDWMSFLPFNFIGQISSNPNANANTNAVQIGKAFHQQERQRQKRFRYEYFNIVNLIVNLYWK